MNRCSDHKETLLLDVHGELTPEQSSTWEKHLLACEDCRQEKVRLCAFIRNAKETLSVPGLSSEEEHSLSSSIQRTLRMHKPDVRSTRHGWWLAPAFGACLVLLFAGWLGLKNFGSPDTLTMTDMRVPEEQAIDTAQALPVNPAPHTASVRSGPVFEAPVMRTAQTLSDDPAPDRAAGTTGPAPEENIRANKELLENMDLLQDMESLEQLVNLLDKPNQETSQLERGNHADRFRVYA
jgi:hypothetical protein